MNLNQDAYLEVWEAQCQLSSKIAPELYPDRSPTDGRRIKPNIRRSQRQRYEDWMKDMGKRS